MNTESTFLHDVSPQFEKQSVLGDMVLQIKFEDILGYYSGVIGIFGRICSSKYKI